MQQVFSAQAADGASSLAKTIGSPRGANVFVSGNLGGGTIKVEAEAPDGSFIPLDGISITAAGVYIVDGAPRRLRLSLSGSTGPSVTAWIQFR